VLQTNDFAVYQLDEQPRLHLVLVPMKLFPPLSTWEEADMERLSKLELPLAELEQRYTLTKRGFSLIFQESGTLENQQLVIDLTAGDLK
jgi:hypothetical protein